MSVLTNLRAELVVHTTLTPEPARPLVRTSLGTLATMLASRQIGTLTLVSPGVQIGVGGVTRAEYLALLARVEALEAGGGVALVPDGALHIDGLPLLLDGLHMVLH